MCYFVVDLAERVSVQFLKIFFAGRHKDAGHIEGTGTDYQCASPSQCSTADDGLCAECRR